MKVAIYGAGAMGSVLGGFLTLGGVEVDLITRNRAHAQAMKRGLTVDCLADGKSLLVQVNALLPEEMGVYDVVFLMTKQKDNEEIARGLLPHLTDEGIVCTTQNGLPEKSVAGVLGASRTYGGVASFGANYIEAGRVALTSKIEGMTIEVGGYENDGKALPVLQEILAKAKQGEFIKTTDNLLGARWSKLAINAAFSGLSVVTGLTFGEVAKRRKTRLLALGVLRECMDVANGLGVKLAPMQGHDMEKLLGGRTPFGRFVAYLLLPFAMKKHKKLTSGMLHALLLGKKCEIDFINGVVVEQGKLAGVQTPLCEKIVEIVHGIENGLYEIGYENVEFFE